LAAYTAVRHFDTAAVADHSLVFHSAVLAAGAFPVFLGAENALAEEAVSFRTIGAVVDRLGLLDLAERPAPDVVRAGKADLDGAVVIDAIVGSFSSGAHWVHSCLRMLTGSDVRRQLSLSVVSCQLCVDRHVQLTTDHCRLNALLFELEVERQPAD